MRAAPGVVRGTAARAAAIVAALLLASFGGAGLRADDEGNSGAEPVERAEPAARDALPAEALVEARVRGRTSGVMQVRHESGQLLLPMDRLGEVMGVTVFEGALRTFISTPLGKVDIPSHAMRVVDNQLYIRANYVRDELRTGVVFNERDYAVEIDPVWRSTDRSATRIDAPLLADIEPPRASVAGIRATANHLRYGDDATTFGGVELAGRLGGGVWSVVAEESTEEPYNFREYHWYTRRDRMDYLVGRQRVQLYSALGDFDLAGLQWGWTNDDQANPKPLTYGANVLLPGRGKPVETIRGESRPGNFVQLRVDGRVLDTQQVGFNGKFNFDRIPLPTRQAAEIEVLIFDPSNLSIPIETRRQRMASSEFLLSDGVVSHRVGGGLAGRFTEKFASSDSALPNGPGGYYQWRQGFSKRVTGEAAFQHNGAILQSYAGAITRLGSSWVAGGGVIHAEGRSGYNFNLEGYLPKWEILAASSSTPSTFGLLQTNDPIRDHRLDTHYQASDRLRIGLMARGRRDGIRDETYALPAVTWRPNKDWYLDARPDLYGDYLLNGYWHAREGTRLRYFRSRNSTFELSHDLTDRSQIGFVTEFENVVPRQTLFYSRSHYTRQGIWYGRLGMVWSADKIGYAATLSAPVAPGVVARAEFQSLPILTPDGIDRGRFLLNLVTDLSQSGGRFVPAHSQNFRRELGGIAGRITLDHQSRLYAGMDLGAHDLSEVKILVNGQVRTKTDAAGRFFIGSVEDGVYQLELDPDGLPIELNPERTRVNVRVAAGAATRADFVVSLEFGMAGRVTDPLGRPLPGVRVELTRVHGGDMVTAWSDAFGLYRLDSVRPGSYHLRAEHEGQVIARRAVTVTDDFLFDQDLVVPRLFVAQGPARPQPLQSPQP